MLPSSFLILLVSMICCSSAVAFISSTRRLSNHAQHSNKNKHPQVAVQLEAESSNANDLDKEADISSPEDDDDDDDEEEDDDMIIRMLRGPLGNKAAAEADAISTNRKAIFILSDTTGSTAKAVVEKSLAQFNSCDERFQIILPPITTNSEDDDDDGCELMQTKMHTFCRTEEQVASVIRKAAAVSSRDGGAAMVVYTLANPELREKTARMCELEGLAHVDLLGPMFSSMATLFQRQPLGRPDATEAISSKRRRRSLSDAYYRRIEAMEFTLKADDGMAPWLLPEADAILVGVSRTGKTPLSVVLSQMAGIRVANVPLIQEVPPPRQLLLDSIDPRRVFCLTLNPADLQRIRKTRLERELGSSSSSTTGGDGGTQKQSNYADRAYLIKDLLMAKRLADDQEWTEIDVTGRAVEETAGLISSILKERFPDDDEGGNGS